MQGVSTILGRLPESKHVYDRQKTFVRESDGIIHLNVEIPNKQNTVRICNKLIQKPHPRNMIVGRTL